MNNEIPPDDKVVLPYWKITYIMPSTSLHSLALKLASGKQPMRAGRMAIFADSLYRGI